jgi:AcrR family transcriptional regulator
MEDVAAAVGLSTSSLYNHFSSKAEILEVAMHRGNGYLQVTLDDILDAATDEGVALRELVDVYSHFALRHAGLVDALVTELRTLGSEAAPLIQAQRDYLGEWVRLGTATAGAERGGHDPAEVRVLVQAIIGAINEVARSHDPLITADLPSAVSALAAAGLGLHQRPAQTSRSTPAASATTRDSMSKTIVAAALACRAPTPDPRSSRTVPRRSASHRPTPAGSGRVHRRHRTGCGSWAGGPVKGISMPCMDLRESLLANGIRRAMTDPGGAR